MLGFEYAAGLGGSSRVRAGKSKGVNIARSRMDIGVQVLRKVLESDIWFGWRIQRRNGGGHRSIHACGFSVASHDERLDFPADYLFYARRSANSEGRRCRQATITDIAPSLNLDCKGIKALERSYRAAQLARVELRACSRAIFPRS